MMLLLVPGVAAEEIRISIDSSAYTVLTGEPIIIPVQITSSWNSDIAGTLTTSSTIEKHTSGASILSQKSGMQSFVIFSDMDSFTINAGTENEEAILSLSVSFDYFEKMPYHVVLDGITVYVEETPSSPSATPESAESTQNELKSTASSPSLSNQPGTNVASPVPSKEQIIAEENADMQALVSQLEEETLRRQDNEEKLTGAIYNDSLFQEWNHTLWGAGYSHSTPEVYPSSDENGTFRIAYEGRNNSLAALDGEVVSLAITGMNISGTGIPPVPIPLAENDTFQAMSNEFLSQKLFDKTMNGNVNRTVQYLSYEFTDNRERFLINATLENGNVTSITLEQEEDSPYLTIILILIFSIVLASVAYRHYARISDPKSLSSSMIQDPALSPEDFKNQAEALWLKGQKKEAFGMLGHALRLILSQHYVDGGEYTTEELLNTVIPSDEPIEKAQTLHCCDEIMFGQGILDDKLWEQTVERVNKYFQELRTE